MVSKKIKEKKRKKQWSIRRDAGRVLTILDGWARRPFHKSDQVGFTAEDKALQGADFWWEKGIIEKTKLFERFSADDQIGRDIGIWLIGGKTIYVQVTAGYHWQDELKARSRGDYYVDAGPHRDIQSVREKFLMIILHAYFAESFTDLGTDKIKEVVKTIEELKNAPVKQNFLQSFLQKLFPHLA